MFYLDVFYWWCRQPSPTLGAPGPDALFSCGVPAGMNTAITDSRGKSHTSRLSRLPGIIRTQELLDHETTPHYWLTVYAMDRGVVPLSSFVEVFVEVQDVNDNAPQTSEPVYYPSVVENSPKDVSIIQINAVDPDARASDRLSYRITSGNPQGFFAINARTGKSACSLCGRAN